MSLAFLISVCCLFGTEPTVPTDSEARTFQVCFIRPEILKVLPTSPSGTTKSRAKQRFDLAFEQVHSFQLSLNGSPGSAVCKIYAKSGRDEMLQYLSTCAVPIQIDVEDWVRIENGDSIFRIFVLDRTLVIPSVKSIRTTHDHTVIDLLAKAEHDGDVVMYMELVPPVSANRQ